MIKLKEKLRNNAFTLGAWISLGHPSIAEIMANSGFDWLAVDMEHSVITLDIAQQLIQTIEASGVLPLVRVSDNNPVLIKRVMDAGAYGVIVPMVNSESDALLAVNSVKYPPTGIRGVGLARAQGYGFNFENYKKWLEKNSVVIVQIEHIEAINNLEEILSVPGIDGSIVGKYDLSASLGIPGKFESLKFKNAVKEYESVCRKLNKPMGFHVVEPNFQTALSYRKKGYNLLAVGVDMLYLGCSCRDVSKQLRKTISR